MTSIALTICALLALPVRAAEPPRWLSYLQKSSAAAAKGHCPEIAPTVVRGTQGYASGFDSGQCYVSIHPMSSTNMVYRDYLFVDDGMLLVFSSYGPGEGPTMTSGREFYFFPRAGSQELLIDPLAQTVAVRMADGGELRFDPETAEPASVERGAVTVSPRVERSERGGVEFPRYAGLMLDAGFRLGELPSGLPEGDATFRDAQGRSCAVKNKELFAYDAPSGEHRLKFTDAQLLDWLKTRCPDLRP